MGGCCWEGEGECSESYGLEMGLLVSKFFNAPVLSALAPGVNAVF